MLQYWFIQYAVFFCGLEYLDWHVYLYIWYLLEYNLGIDKARFRFLVQLQELIFNAIVGNNNVDDISIIIAWNMSTLNMGTSLNSAMTSENIFTSFYIRWILQCSNIVRMVLALSLAPRPIWQVVVWCFSMLMSKYLRWGKNSEKIIIYIHGWFEKSIQKWIVLDFSEETFVTILSYTLRTTLIEFVASFGIIELVESIKTGTPFCNSLENVTTFPLTISHAGENVRRSKN